MGVKKGKKHDFSFTRANYYSPWFMYGVLFFILGCRQQQSRALAQVNCLIQAAWLPCSISAAVETSGGP